MCGDRRKSEDVLMPPPTSPALFADLSVLTLPKQPFM